MQLGVYVAIFMGNYKLGTKGLKPEVNLNKIIKNYNILIGL